MQLKRDRRKVGLESRWGRRKWSSYVKLALILTFAVAIIFSGRHHLGRRRALNPDTPFPPAVTGYGEPIDGDSLWVGDDEVRLRGIDAPEWKQRCERAGGAAWSCGEAARDALARLIGGDAVSCTISERDVYGRMLGHCHAGGRDLNAQMVISGMAVAFGGYGNEQDKARSERRGLWAGDFEEPRDWRATHEWEEAR
ncbi:MAG: thermonuclease family protein [Proteobacteria bacterium]|nr:thermonuclease family protein [Pseudomonadota bacterium]